MTTEDNRLKIFLSHVHEDAALAEVIKTNLEDAFAKRVAVFVSSHAADNPGGDDWIAMIKAELSHPNARMLISLLRPDALTAPWVFIELGAAWIAGQKIFPLCHSGCQLDQLPDLLHKFGGADLNNDECAKRLILAAMAATNLHVSDKWPRTDFLAEMRKAKILPSANVQPNSAAVGIDDEIELLADEEIEILRFLMAANDAGHDRVQPKMIARATNMTLSKTEYYLKRLSEAGLIYDMLNYLTGPSYSIKPEGTKLLMSMKEGK